ncbi:MAG: hypothetical protein GY854_32445 [Deltaproteobacteria bacterium]|nr:hypothetical protein [Deltaproteobacteria bacterium]
MKEIYVVFKLDRVQRAMEITGATRYVPNLPATIQVSGQAYATGLAFFETNRFGWRRFDFLASRGMVYELGQIDETDDYLFIAVMVEDRANAIRQLTNGIELWTLRAFFAGFPDDLGFSSSSSEDEYLLPPELLDTWPAKWYVVGDDGEYDLYRPMVRMAPSRSRALLNAGVEALIETEWLTGSTLSDAEAVVQQNGTVT